MKIGLERFLEDADKFMGDAWGVLSHAAAVSRNLEYSVQVIAKRGLNIKRLFTPEHGFFATAQDQEAVLRDTFGNLQVIPLYGKTKESLHPKPEHMEDLDGVIIDLQDVGARYYTYVWSALIVMRAFARAGKKVIVLDRPNPINGVDVEGPVNEILSFVGMYPVPIRHGKTYGEILEKIARRENLDVIVYHLEGWDRSRYFDELDLPWVMPSPNMSTVDTAVVYPGMCLLEGTNLSEGRGTTRPFEIFGAPYIDPFEMVRHIQVEGAVLRPLYFKPTFNKYAGQVIGGFQIHVLDRRRFRPVETAVRILETVKRLYPDDFAWKEPPYEFEEEIMPIDLLWGSDWLRKHIDSLW